MVRALLALLFVFLSPALALADEARPCQDCHPGLASGVHATIPCEACHGGTHETTGATSRKNDACIACHEGPESMVAASYATSKHGVIAGLEGARWDWSRRFGDASFRAPTCGYCHVRGREHRNEPAEACLECHSPRFAATLEASGGRTLEIGRMKLREAEALADTPEAQPLLERMKTHSLRSLALGIAHQSPDFEWWHGQAALDGDLLRIKSALSRRGAGGRER